MKANDFSKRGQNGGHKAKQKQGAPPIKSLTPFLQLAGGFSLVAVVALIIRGLATPIHHLSTYNTEQMKEVFLGDATWVVLCSNSSDPVPDRFTLAAKEMTQVVDLPLKFGVLDCSGTLPSGKNVYAKFGVKEVAGEPAAASSSSAAGGGKEKGGGGGGGGGEMFASPAMFMVGPGLRPQQVQRKHLRTQTGFNKWLRATAENTAIAVGSTKELDSRCLSKSACAVILKAGHLEDDVKASLKHAMYRHRMLRFVHVDTTEHELSLEKKLGLKPPPQPPAGEGGAGTKGRGKKNKKKDRSRRSGGSSSEAEDKSKEKKRKPSEMVDLDMDDGDSGSAGGDDGKPKPNPTSASALEELTEGGREYHRLMYFEKYPVEGSPKVGTPRWGLAVYEGEWDGDMIVEWLDRLTKGKGGKAEKGSSSSSSEGGDDSGSAAAAKKGKKGKGGLLRPVTRLPTVMTRKWPKVAPKSEPPPGAAGKEEAAAGGGVDGGLGSGKVPDFGGRIKEELIEELRRRQAEKERLKRAQMDEDNWLFEESGEGEDVAADEHGGDGDEGGDDDGPAGADDGEGEERVNDDDDDEKSESAGRRDDTVDLDHLDLDAMLDEL